MGERYTLVVLTYNGCADTVSCLTSLEEQASRQTDFRVLLVDNGSTDGTSEVVGRRFPWCDILTIQENAGPAAGNNRGIQHALAGGAEWVVLLNNDTVVSQDFLVSMAALAADAGEFRILGPVIGFMDAPEDVMTDGVRFNPPGYVGFFERIEVPLILDGVGHQPVEVDVVNGCCMMVAREVFEKIGLFDTSLFIYHDETDFCLRAGQHGFRAGVWGRKLVWHKGARSFAQTGKAMQRYYDARNLGTVVRRFGGHMKGRRGRLLSLVAYVRYLYHRYCTEQEAGQAAAAAAVIDGLLDAIRRVSGQYEERPRRGHSAVAGLFNAVRRVRLNARA